jgi:epsilon-lactone hydrolase
MTRSPRKPRRLLSVLRTVNALVRWRRSRRGPLRPSWDDRFETWAILLRLYATRSNAIPLAMQRNVARRFLPTRRSGPVAYEATVANGVRAEWFRPDRCDPSRVVLYLHGGGYCLGSIDSHRDPVGRLCVAAEARALVIDYRLAPEHPFPAQLDDARAAYSWLLAQGVDPSRLVVAGESAGAGLVLSLLVSLRDAKAPLPAAAIGVSPWVDLEMTGASMKDNARFDYVSRRVLLDYARYFMPSRRWDDPLASALHADLRGLPPMLVMAGGAETLLDDARRLAARAKSHGVDVTFEIEEDMIHAWPLFASDFARAQESIVRMGRYVRERVA